mgnify:CR=1 FL=1
MSIAPYVPLFNDTVTNTDVGVVVIAATITLSLSIPLIGAYVASAFMNIVMIFFPTVIAAYWAINTVSQVSMNYGLDTIAQPKVFIPLYFTFLSAPKIIREFVLPLACKHQKVTFGLGMIFVMIPFIYDNVITYF